MVKTISELKKEIKEGQANAKRAEELYQLLSSYNAYNILLLKAKIEHERLKAKSNNYYLYSDCYEEQINDLFSTFKSNECLRLKQIEGINEKDMIFLIDQDTLLIMNSFDIMNSNIGGLSSIDYDLLKINNCMAKIYKENVYCGDPYYCDSHFEEKNAFGLFYREELITPSYELESRFRAYDNKDIRDILKVQSLDDIQDKINQAKNKKIARVLKNDKCK